MRRENDFYPTPGWATRELLKRVRIGGAVFEPCVGAGDIATELRCDPRICRVDDNDLDRRHQAQWHEDATYSRWWETLPEYDWVITNPPFNVASEVLQCAHKYASNVAMLLRLSFLEPCEGRGAWLAKYPPSNLIVLPRISFTGDGNTDSVTCAWMVWASPDQQSIDIVNPVDERQQSLLGNLAVDTLGEPR